MRFICIHDHSENRTIDQSFIKSVQLIFDQVFASWQSIEGHLREKMMFSLVLHSSHQQKPEKIFMLVVSASNDLVINEGHVGILSKSDFSFVISDQDICWIETSNQTSDNKVQEIWAENIKRNIISKNEWDVNLNR